MKKLSIISTLAEAVLLGARYSIFLLVLSVIVAIPNSLVDGAHGDPQSRHDPGWLLLNLSVRLVGSILVAVKHASILGVLKRSGETTLLRAAIDGAKAWTWTLFRVEILLVGITILVLAPFGLLGMLLAKFQIRGTQFLYPMLAVIYVVFIKYSLADPVVGVENLGARAALQRSWDLTKGHFWYVLGCYLFLSVAGYAFDSLLEQFAKTSPLLHPRIIVLTLSYYVASLWLLTAWRMYWRIKEAESYEPPLPPVDLLAPMKP